MASPFIIDHPSPPLPKTTTKHSPPHRTSIEAFPDFPSSPTSKSSPISFHLHRGHSHLEVPGQNQPQTPRTNRPFRSASNRLPPTALLPSSRNASHSDLTSPTTDFHNNRDDQPQQRLPRATAAPSLAGPSIRPNSLVAPHLLRSSTASIGRLQPNAEELKSESLWADMQRTLADVELSAMNSSHLFHAPHSQALERLRETQLALAQAWARSETDEVAGQESEDDTLDSEPEGGMQAGTTALRTGAVDGMTGSKGLGPGPKGRDGGPKSSKPERKRSAVSQIGKDLEEETERDIELAQRRREANDHYFSQVNRGVLDVVGRLDEVAAAMKAVERESRAVWEEMAGGGDVSTIASMSGMEGDTDGDEKTGSMLMKQLTRATSTTGTELSDSPATPKRTRGRAGTADSFNNLKRTPEKGR